jgi:arginine exporter protein ArgO
LNEWKKQTDAADKRTNRRAVAAMACEQTNVLSLPPLSVSQNEQTNNTFFLIILWIQHSYMDSRLSSGLWDPGFNSSSQQNFFQLRIVISVSVIWFRCLCFGDINLGERKTVSEITSVKMLRLKHFGK